LVGISGVVDIEAGSEHTCALLANQTMRCWGENDSGTLGDGTWDIRTTSVEVEGIDEIESFVVDLDRSCARTRSGKTICWGRAFDDDMRVSRFGEPSSPEAIDLAGARSIASGSSHSCALTVDRKVSCWGLNGYGQLGDGTTVSRMTPAEVRGLEDVESIYLGDELSCALTASGRVSCWGQRAAGTQRLPTELVGLSGVEALSLTTERGCAMTASGRAFCWGTDRRGLLGDGTTEPSSVPREVIIR